MTGSITIGRSVVHNSFCLWRCKHRELSRRNLLKESGPSLPLSRQASKTRSSRSFWTLSFSGAGHLMPYHLGVAKTLLSADQHKEKTATSRLPIKSASGSSSGAIAATVMALMPHRLEEYTDRFLQDRGHAFRNLRQMLKEETSKNPTEQSGETTEGLSQRNYLLLSICTTRCSDGGIELFSFDDHSRDENTTKRLLEAIEASCRIPQSFHPFDMVALNYKGFMQAQKDTYPEAEGIEIDGNAYVDGGIAAPFPPTPLDADKACTGRIVVSPIAGEYFYKPSDDCPMPLLKAICPRPDASWKAPFINSVPISGSGEYDAPLVAVRANPSLQNLRNMTTAMGVVPASPNDHGNGGGILNDWYKRGQEDAYEMLLEIE